MWLSTPVFSYQTRCTEKRAVHPEDHFLASWSFPGILALCLEGLSPVLSSKLKIAWQSFSFGKSQKKLLPKFFHGDGGVEGHQSSQFALDREDPHQRCQC